jgi:glycosyltransferase involved in cell wall biosynthesis
MNSGKNMHVVFLEFVQNWGGAPRSSIELAKRLSKYVKVSIIDPNGCCREFRKAAEDTGVDYHILCPNSKRKYIGGHGNILKRSAKVINALPELARIQRHAVKLLKKINASIICSNNPKSLSITGANISLKRMPLVTFFRGWYRPDMIPFYAKYLYQKRCDLIFAVSNATRAAAICAGINPKKIITLPNPINVQSMIEASTLPLDKPLPQKERAVKLLMPAGLLYTKGQHTAVKAVPYLLEEGYDVVLYLAGSLAPGANKSYVTETKNLAYTLGVADRVEWLGMRHDIPQLMKQSTIVILPSHTEGMPRSLLEAMALSRPVAATPVGGIMDLIIHNISGMFFDVEDEKGLAQCVRYYLSYPDEMERITRNAKLNMITNYTIEQHTNKLLIHLESLLKRR